MAGDKRSPQVKIHWPHKWTIVCKNIHSWRTSRRQQVVLFLANAVLNHCTQFNFFCLKSKISNIRPKCSQDFEPYFQWWMWQVCSLVAWPTCLLFMQKLNIFRNISIPHHQNFSIHHRLLPPISSLIVKMEIVNPALALAHLLHCVFFLFKIIFDFLEHLRLPYFKVLSLITRNRPGNSVGFVQWINALATM